MATTESKPIGVVLWPAMYSRIIQRDGWPHEADHLMEAYRRILSDEPSLMKIITENTRRKQTNGLFD